MNETPQGLKSWANPAAAASRTIEVTSLLAYGQAPSSHQIEQAKGPFQQVLVGFLEHSPQPIIRVPAMHHQNSLA